MVPVVLRSWGTLHGFGPSLQADAPLVFAGLASEGGCTAKRRRDRRPHRLLPRPEGSMPVDAATVRRIAHLARIALSDDEVPHLQGELNAILDFVAQLDEVDVAGVEPMTSVTPMVMKKRPDVVTDGAIADKIVLNAPATEDHYFLVPKVVE
jgi:aspartyl-tRNA(Asn)/glutamyl-tRNA(Gln) amidotransferase subunit C